MALFSIKRINSSLLIGLWHIEDKDEQLFMEKIGGSCPQYIVNKNRQMQWMCSRLLLSDMDKEHNNEIVYDLFNKPSLKNATGYISISHSYNMVAIALNSQEETGIDIELIKGKAKKIAKKYMNEQELTHAYSLNDSAYYTYWCVKESLYKLYGKKELIFKDNIFVDNFQFADSFALFGKLIIKGTTKTYLLQCERVGEYMLAYVVKEIA